jgi:hypothetical protein
MILAKVSLSDTFAKIMTSVGRAPQLRQATGAGKSFRLAAGGWRLARVSGWTSTSVINRPFASTDDDIRLLIMEEV